MKAGNTRLVMSSGGSNAVRLPDHFHGRDVAGKRPNSVLTFARSTGATDFTRQMAAVAFCQRRVTMSKTRG